MKQEMVHKQIDLSEANIGGESVRMLAKKVGPDQFVGGDLDCVGGTCPAVFQSRDGELLIVGEKLSSSEMLSVVSSGKVTVYDHEEVVKVDIELLKKAFEQLG